MATFKAETPYKKADGTYRVHIRITHNSAVRRIPTHLYVTAEGLTRTGKIKDGQVIAQSNQIISRCREICNGLDFDMTAIPIDELAALIKDGLQGEVFRLDFIAYARGKIAEMSKGTARTYTSSVNALERYAGQSLDISAITSEFLRSFEKFIETEPSQRGANRKADPDDAPGKGGRAVSLYLSNIRTLHNLAKNEFNDEDRGIIRIPYSPFAKYKVKPMPVTRKRALSVETIQKIIDLPYEPEKNRISPANLAKDCFILSFVLLGMNSADMYRAQKATGGILTYFRAKTETRRADRAEMRVEVEQCTDRLLDKYADPERLFNFHKLYSTPENFNHTINKGLKRVGERVGVAGLQFYAARHSMATIARSRQVGIDKATVGEMLNHVDADMRVTDIYIDRDWSVIWNAQKRVLELFDWTAIGWDLL